MRASTFVVVLSILVAALLGAAAAESARANGLVARVDARVQGLPPRKLLQDVEDVVEEDDVEEDDVEEDDVEEDDVEEDAVEEDAVEEDFVVVVEEDEIEVVVEEPPTIVVESSSRCATKCLSPSGAEFEVVEPGDAEYDCVDRCLDKQERKAAKAAEKEAAKAEKEAEKAAKRAAKAERKAAKAAARWQEDDRPE